MPTYDPEARERHLRRVERMIRFGAFPVMLWEAAVFAVSIGALVALINWLVR